MRIIIRSGIISILSFTSSDGIREKMQLLLLLFPTLFNYFGVIFFVLNNLSVIFYIVDDEPYYIGLAL